MAAKRTARAPQRDPASDESLLALDPSQGEAPDIPIAIAVSEWKTLAAVARKEVRTLSKLGVGEKQIATLEAFTRRLEQLEKAWTKQRGLLHQGKSARGKKREDAEALKRRMLAAGEWACRHDPYALQTLARIREGSGLADTIQDLRDLASFWEQRKDELARTKLSAKDVGLARKLAEELEELASHESKSPEASRVLELRNRCFWAGNIVAGEIRQCGRYAFSEDPKKAARFPARYRTEHRRTRRVETVPPPAPPPTRPYTSIPPSDGEGPPSFGAYGPPRAGAGASDAEEGSSDAGAEASDA